MENSVDEIKQEIMQATVYQAGAKFKDNYQTLRGVMKLGEELQLMLLRR
jgi:hypothetical protein